MFLPSTSARRGRSLEVWGAVRPAHFVSGRQVAQIQFRAGSQGTWKTVQSLAVRNGRGYFDTRVTFSGGGSVRIAWQDPLAGAVYSRTVKITLR